MLFSADRINPGNSLLLRSSTVLDTLISYDGDVSQFHILHCTFSTGVIVMLQEEEKKKEEDWRAGRWFPGIVVSQNM